MTDTNIQLIENLNAALAKIAARVGATCCGVDTDENDPNHTANAIIAKIDELTKPVLKDAAPFVEGVLAELKVQDDTGMNDRTKGQIASIMLRHGTEEQKQEALAYVSGTTIKECVKKVRTDRRDLLKRVLDLIETMPNLNSSLEMDIKAELAKPDPEPLSLKQIADIQLRVQRKQAFGEISANDVAEQFAREIEKALGIGE